MQLIVSAKGISLSPDTRELIDRRVRSALNRFAPVVRMVQITLTDENGPRGGVDKLCCIVVDTSPLGKITARGRASTVPAAVAAAANRVGHTVSRSVRRSHWQRTNRVRRISAAGERDGPSTEE